MHAIPLTTNLITGAADSDITTYGGIRVHRRPGWVRAQFHDPQLSMVESRPAGVRIAFTTTATAFRAAARAATPRWWRGLSPRADGTCRVLLVGTFPVLGSVPRVVVRVRDHRLPGGPRRKRP